MWIKALPPELRRLCLHVLVNGKVTRLHGCDVNELSIKKNETFVLKLSIVYISSPLQELKHGVIMESVILKRWSSAPNYTGEDFSDCYVVASFTRDSDVYEIANFIGIADYLMDIEPESEKGWKIVRFRHRKHGYLFSILVHENSPLVALCETIVQTLHDNPVFDEDVLNECEDLIEQIHQIASEKGEILCETPAELLLGIAPYL